MDTSKLKAFADWAACIAESSQVDPHLALRRIAEEARKALSR